MITRTVTCPTDARLDFPSPSLSAAGSPRMSAYSNLGTQAGIWYYNSPLAKEIFSNFISSFLPQYTNLYNVAPYLELYQEEVLCHLKARRSRDLPQVS